MPTDTVADEVARLTGAVSRAFIAEDASRLRDPHTVGISSVGECRRQVAYALSKTPTTEQVGPDESRAATLGTWQHHGLLPRLAEQLPGAATEVQVRVKAGGLELVGHIDLDVPETVFDLKTVGEWRLTGIRRMRLRRGRGPSGWVSDRLGVLRPAVYDNHLVQVCTYALARLQQGRPPRYVAWHYLDRANGDEEIVVVPFTNALALLVVDRLTELAHWAGTPDEAPRDEPGPGPHPSSLICNGCPWLRRCWGDDARPGQAGAQRVHTRPDIEQALLDYDDARARESAAKRDKTDALSRLEGVPFGPYGRASYGRARDSIIDDPHAAVRKLRRLGLEVPQMTKRGAVQVKLLPTPAGPEGTTA